MLGTSGEKDKGVTWVFGGRDNDLWTLDPKNTKEVTPEYCQIPVDIVYHTVR